MEPQTNNQNTNQLYPALHGAIASSASSRSIHASAGDWVMKTLATLRKRINEQEVISAKAELHKIGDQRPYFSLTGEHTILGRIDCCGCMHDELLIHWPKLKPIADIHLSDAETGEPMYALENGWYWAGGHKEYCKGRTSDPPNARHLASHLRVAEDYAARIIERVANGELDKQGFASLVEVHRARWHTEACIARRLINQLAEKEAA